MRLCIYLILFISLCITGCYVPGQTVWQDGGNVYNLPRAGVPQPGSLNTRQGEMPMPAKPGSCYAKCLIPAEKELGEFLTALPIYIGDVNSTEVALDTIEIEMQAAKSGWVKKKSDRNCLSANPDDCMVWCLVETERITESFVVVKDTSQTKLYEMTEIYRDDPTQDGILTEWREIVCDTEITNKLIEEIQTFLISSKYLSGEPTGNFDDTTRLALKEYQKESNLPMGQLDLETLDMMGVEY